MSQKKHKPEEIVAKLRQVDVLVSQGQSVAEAVRSIGVTQFTDYRWRKEHGGLKSEVVSRMWWKLPNSGLRACNVGSSQAARSRDIGTRG